MSDFCHSCTMPLNEQSRRAETDYCGHCADESGSLQPRAAVQQGIAGWMQGWQGPMEQAEAMRRADLFMQAMPAWQTG